MREQLQSIIGFYSTNINDLSSVEFYALNKEVMRLARRASGMDNIQLTGMGPELHFLGQYLAGRAEPVVLDVGAYRGDYSMGALKANPGAKVFAFEPHPRTFAILKPKSRQAGFAAFNLGCSDAEGALTLYDIADEDRSFRTTAYQEIIEGHLDRRSESFEVRTTTIDKFCAATDLDHLDLLKIDAEGHEMHILNGAAGMLRSGKIEAIQFEFNELNAYSGRHFKEFVDILPEYRFFLLLPDGIAALGEYDPREHENYVYQNIVAIARWSKVLRPRPGAGNA